MAMLRPAAIKLLQLAAYQTLRARMQEVMHELTTLLRDGDAQQTAEPILKL